MATTSLWHIKGRLKDLIAYVENPEKTVAKDKDLQDFYNVFSYVSRPEATENGEYVSAINCLKEIALQQMILTKKQYGKDDGYIAWHGYQSFKPGEVAPEQAHEIGLKLAGEMWGDRFQIIVTTHLDKDHLSIGKRKMLAGSAGGSVKMRNKRHRNNFIKVDGFIEYGKKRIFVVIKFILAIGKNICQRKLFVCYHIGTTPLLVDMVNCYWTSQFYHKPVRSCFIL